jgi:heme exporter protein A
LASNEEIIVEATGVSVVISRRPILRDINLTISRGESIAIMGPNGVGKSTLLSCLAGAIRPASGQISFFGCATPRSVAAKQFTGFAGHETGLYAELTALENLAFAARMYQLDEPTKKAQSVMLEAGLAPLASIRVAQLSRGMRQRLALIRATIHQPALILLDEPFASLDSTATNWLELRFQRWRDTKRTICFASHDIEQSRQLADRIVWLESGRIASIDKCSCTPAHSLRVA